MLANTVTTTDFGASAVLVAFLAFLVYRIFRREPQDRIVRLGLFIERKRFTDDGEQITERKEWP